MKKSKIFIAIVFIIVLGIMFCVFMVENQSLDMVNTDDTEILTETKTYNHPDIDYAENGVDTDYNYITNYEVITNLDMPLCGVAEIGDSVDGLLKDNGVTGSEVTIVNKNKKGSYIKLTAVTSKNPDMLIHIDYQFTKNKMNIYLEY